jgi:uncharacterized protein YneF (UPF0154 family)
MKELLAPHWFIGAAVSVGGGLAYRLGPHWFTGTALTVCKILGLICVAMGLFVVMRGVSHEAQKRPPLDENEAVRRIPQLGRRRRSHDDEQP